MARPSRFTIENGVYHVLCRGHNKQKIFHDQRDFSKYLKILSECKEKYCLKVYHYVLMENHPHFIMMASKGTDLSDSMRTLNQTYAQYYRSKYGGTGYVWQDRFKSFIIERGKYMLTCGRYIELNPVKAGIVSHPKDYPWSSYRVYAMGEKNSMVDISPEYLALSDDSMIRVKKYAEFVNTGLHERRGLARYFRSGVYGDEFFVEYLKRKGLKQVSYLMGRPNKEKIDL